MQQQTKANYVQGAYPIVEKRNIARDCYDVKVLAPELVALAKPGQFVHIRVPGFYLRRPISICALDREAETLRLVFEVRGEGTEALAQCRVGELMDVMGPLGNGFTLSDSDKKVILVGGGIGVPPMYGVAAHYGANATVILGYQTAARAILVEDFKALGCNVMVCTDDGTLGEQGNTVQLLQKCLQEPADLICACGPKIMLQRVAETAKAQNIACELSLEERMGCGVGACLVCACRTVKNGEEFFAHVCKDGPVFAAEKVVFDSPKTDRK